ncbi:MAG TPA: hypothetical protein VH253_03120 [Phycisphaerae bacterium]|nr:hypothetical protein [Phycisphaerae bacterium]
MRKKRAIAVGLCVLIGWTALGQSAAPGAMPYRFRNVAIVGGGFVTGIVFDPARAGHRYARTDIGSAYRWEADAAGGRWAPMLDWVGRKDWNLWGIESMAVDPAAPERVYLAAGTYTRGSTNGVILRSKDGGRTFAQTAMPVKMGGNEDGRFSGERLAVDGGKDSIVYFGSRNDGLWRSGDFGEHWEKSGAFPVQGRTNGVGVIFVIFDRASAEAGQATPVIYVGVSAGPGDGAGGVYRTTDAGGSWARIAGQPTGKLLPTRAALAADGELYVTYADVPGPNGMSDGAVWRFDAASGAWSDITPARPEGSGGRVTFGYSAVTVDAQHPRTVMVATMDRWSQGDDIYRSTDGGAHWEAIAKAGVRDSSASPWIKLGHPVADAGHWFGDVEIDPFDADHALYTTGATIWETHDLTAADHGVPTHWKVGAVGLEETVVLDLMSPPVGPLVVSAVGDIGGFAHRDLDVSPAEGRMAPAFTNTEGLDYAGSAPATLVRVGTIRNGANGTGHGAFSRDSGGHWRLFPTEPANSGGGGAVAVSADGKTFLWAPRGAELSWSADEGATWTACAGVPRATGRNRLVVAADKVDAAAFYVLDGSGELLASHDGGRTFVAAGAAGLRGAAMKANPMRAGELWMAGREGLSVSADGGKSVRRIAGVQSAAAVTLGKAARQGGPLTVFVAGTVGGRDGIFRSDDGGGTWMEITDAQHQFSNSAYLAGDPRTFGRVYIGTPGRGVMVGDVAGGGSAAQVP